MGDPDDTLFSGDRARDHHDRARDHTGEPFVRKPGHQYAEHYPDPFTGHPLQTYPEKRPGDFDSIDDWLTYVDALTRWTNFLPPRRRIPGGDEVAGSVPMPEPPRPGSRRKSVKSRHVGIRLTERNFELLDELARAHGVPPGTMARMLIVRAVRAAADESKNPPAGGR